MSLAALAWAAILAVAAALAAPGMPGSMLRSMRDLALPAPLMRPLVAWAHLLVQLTLALGLVLAPRPLSWLFTIGGVVLACIYLVTVWRARGHECRCLSRTPHRIGPATIVRNVSLLVLAVLSLGSEGIAGVTLDDWPALIPLTVAVVAEAAARRTV